MRRTPPQPTGCDANWCAVARLAAPARGLAYVQCLANYLRHVRGRLVGRSVGRSVVTAARSCRWRMIGESRKRTRVCLDRCGPDLGWGARKYVIIRVPRRHRAAPHAPLPFAMRCRRRCRRVCACLLCAQCAEESRAFCVRVSKCTRTLCTYGAHDMMEHMEI